MTIEVDIMLLKFQLYVIGNSWGTMARDGNFYAKFHFIWHNDYLPD